MRFLKTRYGAYVSVNAIGHIAPVLHGGPYATPSGEMEWHVGVWVAGDGEDAGPHVLPEVYESEEHARDAVAVLVDKLEALP